MTGKSDSRSCYNCDEAGHIAKDCPKPVRPRKAKTGKAAGKGPQAKAESTSATASASADVQMDYVRQVFCEPGSDGVAISDTAFKGNQPAVMRSIHKSGAPAPRAQVALGYMFRSCVAGDPVPNLVFSWSDQQPFTAAPESDGTATAGAQCFLVGETSLMIPAVPIAPNAGRLIGFRQLEGSSIRFVWAKETAKGSEQADANNGWFRLGTRDELTMVALAALTGIKHGLSFHPASGVGKVASSATNTVKTMVAADIPIVDKMKAFFDKQDWSAMRYWAVMAAGPGASSYDPRLMTSGDRVLKSGRLSRSVMWNMVGWSAAALSRGITAQIALGSAVDSSSAAEMGLFA